MVFGYAYEASVFAKASSVMLDTILVILTWTKTRNVCVTSDTRSSRTALARMLQVDGEVLSDLLLAVSWRDANTKRYCSRHGVLPVSTICHESYTVA